MKDKSKEIEDLRRENERLKVSIDRFQFICGKTSFAYQSLDEQGNIIDVNPVWCNLMGYAREEVIGRWFGEFLVSDHKEKFNEGFSRFKSAGEIKGVRFEMVKKDGSSFFAEFTGKISYDKNGCFQQTHCVFSIITECKICETALKDSEERFKILFEYAPDGYYLTDLKGRFVDGNRMSEQILGWKKEELIGKNYLAAGLLSPEKIVVAEADLEKNLRGEPAGPTQYALQRKDGSRIDVEIRTYPIRIKNEDMILGIARDITERKQLDRRFELVAQQSSDFIYEWDLETDELKWFGDMEKSLGYDQGEIPPNIQGWLELIHPDDRGKLKKAVDLHRNSTDPIHEEYRVRRKDNTWAYWQDNAAVVLDESNKPVKWIGGCKDITMIKELENNLKDKIKSLELFQKSAVGRELKMIELKAKIRELEEALRKRTL